MWLFKFIISSLVTQFTTPLSALHTPTLYPRLTPHFVKLHINLFLNNLLVVIKYRIMMDVHKFQTTLFSWCIINHSLLFIIIEFNFHALYPLISFMINDMFKTTFYISQCNIINKGIRIAYIYTRKLEKYLILWRTKNSLLLSL